VGTKVGTPLSDDDKLSAVRFLINGGDEATARLLLSSEMEVEDHGVDMHGTHYLRVILFGPRAVHDGTRDDRPVREAIVTALKAAFAPMSGSSSSRRPSVSSRPPAGRRSYWNRSRTDGSATGASAPGSLSTASGRA
jgi:hypothetical protein